MVGWVNISRTETRFPSSPIEIIATLYNKTWTSIAYQILWIVNSNIFTTLCNKKKTSQSVLLWPMYLTIAAIWICCIASHCSCSYFERESINISCQLTILVCHNEQGRIITCWTCTVQIQCKYCSLDSCLPHCKNMASLHVNQFDLAFHFFELLLQCSIAV